MSTPTERATEALHDPNEPGQCDLCEKRARVALTAALTDPDNPDALARVLARPDPRPWSGMRRETRDTYRSQAAVVRAFLLGADL